MENFLVHTFFYKNNFIKQFYKNEAQIFLKIMNKLRTIEARFQMQIELQLLKNTTHQVIICGGVSLQIFLQL